MTPAKQQQDLGGTPDDLPSDPRPNPKCFEDLEQMVVTLAARHGLNVDRIRKELRSPHLGALVCATYGVDRPRQKVGTPSLHEENLRDGAAIERHRRAGLSKRAACAAALQERLADGRRLVDVESFERAYDRMLQTTCRDVLFWFGDGVPD